MNWEELKNIEGLNNIDEESAKAPVVIFKHSTRCSISAAAHDRLERKWDDANHPASKAYYLDLIQYREVSNEITNRYGIEHQSPQVLVIDNGNCVYDASHLGISYGDVSEKLMS
ncbi:bacillithiol system redox-active protein YtxJ [Marinoscillum sp. MHG1-6]|uniref:bacillithiol system redox-active protein YtxJ n=1 Tax=Marinoscillum sp. MHG1-6 TaxID=2959627 RepID=UPI0021583D0E|nr:bacillithiol system redox-active protein YtxJ [Marinoscillum sp. MHG1-6]